MEIKTPTFKKIFILFKKLLTSYKIVTFILAILLPLIFVGVVFYLYAWEVRLEDQPRARKISVDQNLYNEVMEKIKQREINFQQEENKIYIDPFK